MSSNLFSVGVQDSQVLQEEGHMCRASVLASLVREEVTGTISDFKIKVRITSC